MANISTFAEKLMLDFVLNTQAATRPVSWGIGVSLGTPTSVSASEIAAGSGFNRLAVGFGAAASPAGSATNSAAVTFGPASAAATIIGVHVWDNSGATAGNMLWYGTLATARTLASGDSLVIASGALVITLA
jgi:hypothetical protein